MKICRFKNNTDEIRIGLVADNSTLLDLKPAGITALFPLLENESPVAELNRLDKKNLPQISLAEVKLLAPVERQEVWAAGVTYLRSKTARMEESDFSATAHDKVYAAECPEIFFKSLPDYEQPFSYSDNLTNFCFELAFRDRMKSHESNGHLQRNYGVRSPGQSWW